MTQCSLYTHGDKNLHTRLVNHYNELLYGQSSERSTDEVTYFYVGDLFLYTLAQKHPQHKGTNYVHDFIQNSVYQASHCSTSLIGCVNLFRRLYFRTYLLPSTKVAIANLLLHLYVPKIANLCLWCHQKFMQQFVAIF